MTVRVNPKVFSSVAPLREHHLRKLIRPSGKPTGLSSTASELPPKQRMRT